MEGMEEALKILSLVGNHFLNYCHKHRDYVKNQLNLGLNLHIFLRARHWHLKGLFLCSFPKGSRKKVLFLVDSPLRPLAPQPRLSWKKFFFPKRTTPYPHPLLVDCPLKVKTFFCGFPNPVLFPFIGVVKREIKMINCCKHATTTRAGGGGVAP